MDIVQMAPDVAKTAAVKDQLQQTLHEECVLISEKCPIRILISKERWFSLVVFPFPSYVTTR